MDVTTGVRAIVLERDGHRCRRCLRSLLDSPASIHHRKPRGMGGTNDARSKDVRNLVLLCGSGTTGCHGWVESHRADASEEGWLVSSYDDLDRPVVDLTGTAVTLCGDGTLTLAPDEPPPFDHVPWWPTQGEPQDALWGDGE